MRVEHEFAPMEEFLIDFCEECSKEKFYNINLRNYFERNPLDKKRNDRINVAIENLCSYDVICAKYGIGTKKLNYEEYAKEYGISTKRAKKLFEETAKCLTQNFDIKLCYMAIKPEHLQCYILDILEEVQKESRTTASHWPPFNKDCPIYVVEDCGEAKIFFRTKKVRVDNGSMKDVLNGLVYNGNCSGYNISRLPNGDIRVYFNPIIHEACDRRRTIEKVVEELSRHKLCLDELDT